MDQVVADLLSLEKIRQGKEAGLKELMERHREALFRFIFRYVHNEADAAELTEQTFLRVYQKAGRFKPRGTAKVKTWIFSIAGNLCKDWIRKSRRRGEILPLNATGEGEEEGKEIQSLKLKTFVAGVLTLPILFLAFDSMIPGLSFNKILSPRIQGWLELLLATPAILWAGGMFFARGWRSIVNRNLNMFTLIMLGVGAAKGDQLLGFIGIADPIKSTSKEAIASLHEMGIEVVMCTGDNPHTAKAVAKALGIDEVHAEVSPEDKQRIVNELKAKGHRVAMAGDGINDAPALAAADVGIAMGTGTDVAIESAGLTLVKGDLRGIVSGLRLSRLVMRNIRQNLFFAFIYNATGVPIAAGILYPIFGILLSPMIAGAAMALSSVSVVTNALRLSRLEF